MQVWGGGGGIAHRPPWFLAYDASRHQYTKDEFNDAVLSHIRMTLQQLSLSNS